MLTPADIQLARRRIGPLIRQTPVVDTAPWRLGSFGSVALKLESLQVSGSFKIRGAANKMLSMSSGMLAAGVVTASGGNHGAGVAYAARHLGVSATVFVPESTPAYKIAGIRSHGAMVEVVGQTWDDADRHAREVADATQAVYVHPFADPAVVAGQGTLGFEVAEQAPDADVVVIAIGGGGLIAGMAVALHSVRPGARIIGVEPLGAPTMLESLRAGQVVELERLATRAGTLAPRRTTQANLELVRTHVEDIVLVSDEEMDSAVAWLERELAISVELGAAATVAALLTGKLDSILSGKRPTRICALVCGRGASAQPG